MDIDIGRLVRGDAEDKGPSAMLEGGLLIVDCRRCLFRPVPGSKECLGCMVRTMAATGSADRVVLRTGRDTEISGRAGSVIRDAASMMRWSIPDEKLKGRCRLCPASRREVMTAAWNSFPENDPAPRLLLDGIDDERQECKACTLATARALDQMEEGIRRIRAGIPGGGR